MGNRIAHTTPSGTESYSYPSTSNRLASVTSTAPARTFLYDANGSVTSDTRGSQVYGYAYDTAGRLLSVSLGGVVQADYKYDWRGQQATRRFPASGQVIHSVFNDDGQRIAEYDEATGALIRAYVWLDDRPLAVIEGGQVYFVRTDHIGRPVFATTSAGTQVWSASYLPFGGVHVTTGAPIDLRFPGQWFQLEAGLHQNWMRDYDPTTGRYIEADPLGLVDGARVYGYARQNPGRWVDPRGEQSDPGHAAASEAAEEEGGMCVDPCAAARQRVRDAKAQHKKINGTAICTILDNKTIRLSKWFKWSEECAARRARDFICPTLPSDTDMWPNSTNEYLERLKSCSYASLCATMMLLP